MWYAEGMNLQIRVQIPKAPDAPTYRQDEDVNVYTDPALVGRILNTITVYESEQRVLDTVERRPISVTRLRAGKIVNEQLDTEPSIHVINNTVEKQIDLGNASQAILDAIQRDPAAMREALGLQTEDEAAADVAELAFGKTPVVIDDAFLADEERIEGEES